MSQITCRGMTKALLKKKVILSLHNKRERMIPRKIVDQVTIFYKNEVSHHSKKKRNYKNQKR